MKLIKVVFGFGRAPATEYGGVEAMQDANRYGLAVAVLTGLAMIPVLALLVWFEIPPVVQAGLIVVVPLSISWVATKRITHVVNARWKASMERNTN